MVSNVVEYKAKEVAVQGLIPSFTWINIKNHQILLFRIYHVNIQAIAITAPRHEKRKNVQITDYNMVRSST